MAEEARRLGEIIAEVIETMNPTEEAAMTQAGKQYYGALPIDFEILALLPEIGTIGGVHWKGRRVVDLVGELRSKEFDVDSALVQARLRSMKAVEYVKTFNSGQGGLLIWAITPKGKKHLANKEEQLNA